MTDHDIKIGETYSTAYGELRITDIEVGFDGYGNIHVKQVEDD